MTPVNVNANVRPRLQSSKAATPQFSASWRVAQSVLQNRLDYTERLKYDDNEPPGLAPPLLVKDVQHIHESFRRKQEALDALPDGDTLVCLGSRNYHGCLNDTYQYTFNVMQGVTPREVDENGYPMPQGLAAVSAKGESRIPVVSFSQPVVESPSHESPVSEMRLSSPEVRMQLLTQVIEYAQKYYAALGRIRETIKGPGLFGLNMNRITSTDGYYDLVRSDQADRIQSLIQQVKGEEARWKTILPEDGRVWLNVGHDSLSLHLGFTSHSGEAIAVTLGTFRMQHKRMQRTDDRDFAWEAPIAINEYAAFDQQTLDSAFVRAGHWLEAYTRFPADSGSPSADQAEEIPPFPLKAL